MTRIYVHVFVYKMQRNRRTETFFKGMSCKCLLLTVKAPEVKNEKVWVLILSEDCDPWQVFSSIEMGVDDMTKVNLQIPNPKPLRIKYKDFGICIIWSLFGS